jgi:hypothetical protein
MIYCNDDGDDYIRGDCKMQRSVIKISIPRATQKMTQEKKRNQVKRVVQLCAYCSLILTRASCLKWGEMKNEWNTLCSILHC